MVNHRTPYPVLFPDMQRSVYSWSSLLGAGGIAQCLFTSARDTPHVCYIHYFIVVMRTPYIVRILRFDSIRFGDAFHCRRRSAPSPSRTKMIETLFFGQSSILPHRTQPTSCGSCSSTHARTVAIYELGTSVPPLLSTRCLQPCNGA